jgi:hypothetical protein
VAAPTSEQTAAYLADNGGSWEAEQIDGAFAAEKAAQSAVCTVPADDADWPEDLAEALMRRVAHNLALRALPLGVQASLSEGGVAQTRVGGTDAEVRRLEGPYRKRVVG